MKKTKVFLLASALVVITAGAFATGKKFFINDVPQNLYYSPSLGNYVEVTPNPIDAATGLLYNPSTTLPVAKIQGGSSTFPLYTFDGSAFQVVYSSTF